MLAQIVPGIKLQWYFFAWFLNFPLENVEVKIHQSTERRGNLRFSTNNDFFIQKSDWWGLGWIIEDLKDIEFQPWNPRVHIQKRHNSSNQHQPKTTWNEGHSFGTWKECTQTSPTNPCAAKANTCLETWKIKFYLKKKKSTCASFIFSCPDFCIKCTVFLPQKGTQLKNSAKLIPHRSLILLASLDLQEPRGPLAPSP